MDSSLAARAAFFDTVLSEGPIGTKADFRRLCDGWRTATNAAWAWLWIYNDADDHFELSSYAHDSQLGDIARQYFPPHRHAAGANSVAKYSSKMRQPVFVSNATIWSAKHDGTDYRVIISAHLQSLGAVSFDCIPLFPSIGSDRPEVPCTGVITSHYEDSSRRVSHEHDTLLEMGHLTALLVNASQTAEHRAVLLRLNKMAGDFSRSGISPSTARDDYLAELIVLIKDRLRVGGVSIFFRRSFADSIECIASSALVDHNNVRVPLLKLNTATYEANEGLTGECYAKNIPFVCARANEMKGMIGKFKEMRQHQPVTESDPLLLYPIPPPTGTPKRQERALGVIRCVEHTSLLVPDELCAFDPTEQLTMKFIAEQVGPVLQSFAERIERERTIAIARHDIYAPLVHIRDSITKVLDSANKNAPIPGDLLLDIQVSNWHALNLAKRLQWGFGPDLEARLITRTAIDKDIFDRIKSMLDHVALLQYSMTIRYTDLACLPPLFVDRQLLERALYNLLMNAFKYGKRMSEVEIKARAIPKFFEIDIINSGLGVTKNEAPLIFEPYYRSLRADSCSTPGMGLGLAIARHAIRAHGGDVRLSHSNHPTVFTVQLPANLTESWSPA